MGDVNQVQVEKSRYINVQRGKIVSGCYCPRGDGDSGSSNLRDRGSIDDFTESSRKRLKRYLRNADAKYSVFITLTYPPGFGHDGSRGKRDVEAFCKRYKRTRPDSNKWSVCWFQEWQSNGALHYHVFGTHYWHMDRVAEAWYEVVGSGNPDHLRAGTQIRKIRGKTRQILSYAAKYASKMEQKIAPEDCVNIGRYWGVKGYRVTVEASTVVSAALYRDPEVFELYHKYQKQRDSMVKAGIIGMFHVEHDNFTCHCYIFGLELEDIRKFFADIVNQIEEYKLI